MDYGLSTPWLGQGQASAEQIDRWFQQHNPQAPALGALVVRYARGLNPDLVAAQISEETGWWTSDWATKHNNPAGIGVTGQAGVGLSFTSIEAGISAQTAHLLSYVIAPNPYAGQDPRYSAMDPATRGSKPTLGDFGAGIWAADPGYAAKLVAHANSLVSFVKGDTMAVSDFYGMPLAWLPADPSNYDSSRGVIRLFVVHDEEADTALSAVNRFQTPGQQASSHFVTDADHGRIIQCVASADTAYTVGNYAFNQVSVNCENPGYAGKPYPDATVDACARAAAYVAQKYQIPVVRLSKDQVKAGQAGFCGHEDIPDPNNPNLYGGEEHHTDPGPTWPWDQFLGLVQQYLGAAPPPPPVDPNARVDPVTGFKLVQGFRAYVEWLEGVLGPDDALLDLGRPISNEFVRADGLTVQWFERGRLEWHPGARPARFDVLRGLVGTEGAAADRAAYPDKFRA